MTQFELVLRTGAVLQLLLLAALFLGARRRDHTPLLASLCCLGAAAFVLTSVPDARSWLGLWTYPLTALCVAKVALFWLFARGLFADAFRVRTGHILAVGVTAGFGLWQQLVYIDQERAGTAAPWERLASFGFEALMLAFVLLALAEAWRGLATDLIERRRRTRILFVAAVGGYLAVAAVVQGYNRLSGIDTPAVWVSSNLMMMIAFALVATWTLIRIRPASWLEPDSRPAAGSRLDPAEKKVLASLQRALEADRIYREEGLTIGDLAERLGTREYVLRRVINCGLGFRNFNDFLHAHRIGEVCTRLGQPEEARRPVLAIALDAGYASIGPFNRAFKARTGMTPTTYRRSSQNGRKLNT
ncbi:MAG: helix-turn-helix transcriptional regulator [Gammaproteobacteria bacterium]|nr:helix-turn-helix transcriptional regulator [Gammaproteobacteria bacterium]